jgi:D-3-phosphoglycerate dehydrogenase / 2-oxoglutarate reductase
MKVLIADPLDPRATAKLRDAGFEVAEVQGLAGAELIAALQGVHAVLVRGATRLTGEVLRAAPSLQLVVRAGTGLDNVDVAVAREQKIQVRNTPGANAVSVAELVFGMLLMLERKLADAQADLRGGRWEKSKYQGRELAGQHLGLIGFGRIGREVAQRARAFTMRVLWTDPLIPSPPAGFEWTRRVPLDILLRDADILSLHVPLNDETRAIMTAGQIARMKPGAVLVNCARGGLVDENGLHDALASGKLRGAALDVFAKEPPGDHPLLALPNVVATPHLGAATREAQERAGIEAAEIAIEVLGKPEVDRV